jgi:Tol biopolymer transport system component
VEDNSTLRRLELSSGISQVICKTLGSGRGGAWGRDNTILFTPDTNSPIMQVSANGGAPKAVTKLDSNILDGSHRFPAFLPDGRHFLFTLWSNHVETAAQIGGIYVGSLDNGEIRKLSSDSSQAVLAGNNRLLIYRNESLQAVSFHPEKFEITGTLEEISAQPLFLPASGSLGASASEDGDLAYALTSGEGTSQLAWIEADGGVQKPIGAERLGIQNLVIAPDGKHFAAQVVSRAGAEIWVADSERAVMTRLTRGGFDATGPVWSADSRNVSFTSQASGNLSVYLQPADASRPPEIFFTQANRDFRVRSWFADGKSMLLESNMKGGGGRLEIWLLDVENKKAEALLTDQTASLSSPVLSPDGNWLAYVSDESGSNQIYIRPYPALDRKWQISQGGTLTQSNFFALAATTYLPHWRNDGSEILFITLNGTVDAVTVQTNGDNLIVGPPRIVLKPDFPLMALAPTPDHSKFLGAIVPGDVTSEPIRVVLHSSNR